MTVADSSRYAKIGDNLVDAPVVCVITRFGLRGIVSLLSTYRDYRSVVAEERRSKRSGLLRSAFLIESHRTCYVLSVWASYDAIPRFGTDTPSHVGAARAVFGRCRSGTNGGPEMWSTKWGLRSVSNNLSWDDFDLRDWLIGIRQDGIPSASVRSEDGLASWH
jgi:hypothetical protein